MKCFKCEAEIPGDSKFCLSCGERIVAVKNELGINNSVNKENVQQIIDNSRKKYNYILYFFVLLNVLMGIVLAVTMAVVLLDHSKSSRVINRFQNAIINNPHLSEYLNNVEIKQTGSDELNKYTYCYHTIECEVKEEFETLTDDEKYFFLLDLIKVIDNNKEVAQSEAHFYTINKNLYGYIEKIKLYCKDKEYTMNLFDKSKRVQICDYVLIIDGKASHRPKEHLLG